ncbi:beta-lactamase-like protein [Boeremia exigua]|uniref:beta-lactamase-like protein n=1 Tax=Boeremia exigua TaxID=749465 RepID=UPI001E8CF100|nr:beta-lactamase-like protein [Boeremia exigua]KAH6632885.1 beta-lactamase-like protein [Boeremia exigua]
MAETRNARVHAPAVDIPLSEHTCTLSIVDTTCVLTVPAETLVDPPILGHELMNFPTFSFLISNSSSGKQILFDLGCKKDFWNLPQPVADVIDAKVPGISVNKNLSEILAEGGVDTNRIDAAIISHHHYDHIGDPSTFPPSMELLVGPGFSDALLPGYPKNEASPIFESDLVGRSVRELAFSDQLAVAGYRAIDYFADGSFYILDTPGHAIGHVSALARTTSNTFVFLGGDICHFGGAFRPTQYVPMPEILTPHDVGHQKRRDEPYPHSIFTNCHPDQANARTVPYYTPCCRSDGWYVDPPRALESVEQLKALDADDRILVLIAHDPAMLNVVTFFPHGNANDWQILGWKSTLRWRFLDELPSDVRELKYLVDGTYMEGKRVKNLQGTRL